MTPFDFRRRKVCGLKSKKDKGSRGVANLKKEYVVGCMIKDAYVGFTNSYVCKSTFDVYTLHTI